MSTGGRPTNRKELPRHSLCLLVTLAIITGAVFAFPPILLAQSAFEYGYEYVSVIGSWGESAPIDADAAGRPIWRDYELWLTRETFLSANGEPMTQEYMLYQVRDHVVDPVTGAQTNIHYLLSGSDGPLPSGTITVDDRYRTVSIDGTFRVLDCTVDGWGVPVCGCGAEPITIKATFLRTFHWSKDEVGRYEPGRPVDGILSIGHDFVSKCVMSAWVNGGPIPAPFLGEYAPISAGSPRWLDVGPPK